MWRMSPASVRLASRRDDSNLSFIERCVHRMIDCRLHALSRACGKNVSTQSTAFYCDPPP